MRALTHNNSPKGHIVRTFLVQVANNGRVESYLHPVHPAQQQDTEYVYISIYTGGYTHVYVYIHIYTCIRIPTAFGNSLVYP